MSITGYDHVQIAIPAGGEPAARGYYGDLLGMTELPKPSALAVRGGCWFSSGSAMLHLGVETGFASARKAHPAFRVSNLTALAASLDAAGYRVIDGSGEIAGVQRFHSSDPFGNRLEFIQA